MKTGAILMVLLRVLALISVCSTAITPVMASPDGKYTASVSGQSGFVPIGELRKKAFIQVNDFAASKNSTPEIIAANEIPTAFARWPQVDVTFRLAPLKAGQPSENASGISIENHASYDAMGQPIQSDAQIKDINDKDFYQKLRELDELRDKGLLTNDEFQKKKAKVLARLSVKY